MRYDAAILTGRPLVTSLIVYYELQFGAFASRNREQQWDATLAVLEEVLVEPLDQGDVTTAAAIRDDLRRMGTPIGPYDLLIAGQALNRGWTVVTSNTKEFSRVSGLALEDWSS